MSLTSHAAGASGTGGLQSGAARALQRDLMKLKEEEFPGFDVTPDESNQFRWNIIIFGPPSTIYEGGCFKAVMNFPHDYPYSPPSLRFHTKIWHPNIYQNGDVCISILHPPTPDPTAGELPEERWNPTQTVRTILISVISLLNEPNISSPANVDASVAFRDWREGRSTHFSDVVRKQVQQSRLEAETFGIKIPAPEDWIEANKERDDGIDEEGQDHWGWPLDDGDEESDDDDIGTEPEDSGNATDH